MGKGTEKGTRAGRLRRIMAALRDGETHRAGDLARALGVSERTIWRDMARLEAAGFPVAGTRGAGYRIAAEVTLPPLNLTRDELEVLHLGLAVIGQSGEEPLMEAAARLSTKIDNVLAEDTEDGGRQFGHALPPFARGTQGYRWMPSVRAAIRARQKLALRMEDGEEAVLRPLKLDYWGRVWTILGWDELTGDFSEPRLDQVTELRVLPELFVDEPGKRLEDALRR